jgi:hypothetical protein
MLPENGYESPHLPDNEEGFFHSMGNGTHRVGERRRAGRNVQKFVAAETPDNRDNIGTSDTDLGREEDTEIKTIGIRDRVGCYTWTWFTMTMATGGIANVLHSSTVDRGIDCEFDSDDLQFHIDLTGCAYWA